MKFTVIKNNTGLLTKVYSKVNGCISKISHGNLYSGVISKESVNDLKEFNSFLDNLNSDEAIMLGYTEQPFKEIVSSKNLREGTIARTKEFFKFADDSKILLFDIDETLTPDEAIRELVKLDPNIATVEKIIRYSNSSFIYDKETDTYMTEGTSLHIYVKVDSLKEVDAYIESLKGKSWEIGSAFIKVDAVGRMLERFVFDAAVFSPERLVFEAPAIYEEPLEQRAPENMYIPGGALPIRSFEYNLKEADKNLKKAKQNAREESRLKRGAFENAYATKARTSGQNAKNIMKDIRALLGGVLNKNFVLTDMNNVQFFAGSINASMDKKQIQDPLEPNGLQKAIIYWNDGEPVVHSFKSGVFKVELKNALDKEKEDLSSRGYEYNASGNKLLPTMNSLETLLFENNISYSYDLIKKNPRLMHDDINWDGPNPEKRSEQLIRDISLRMDMPPSIVDVVDSLSNVEKYQTNKVMDMVKEGHAKWSANRKDYIQQLVDTLKPNNNINKELITKWLIQCVAAWDFEELSPQNGDLASYENVLVLQGKQGLQKTTWFRNILPYDLQDYFKEGAMLDPSNKDSVKQNTSYAIVELGELESTFNKADNGALKAFLSSRWDEYRLPYARKEEKHRRSASFCGSVNDNQFLRDRSGARRFWIIPVTDIDMQSMQLIPKDELWGQVMDLYLSGKPWYLDTNSATYKELEETHEAFEAYNPAQDVIAYLEACGAQNAPNVRLSASAMFARLHIHKAKADVDALAMKLERLGYPRYKDRTFRIPWIEPQVGV